MTSRRAAAVLAVAAAAVGVVALGWRFGSGARYRLYTNPHAGDCWRAVELTSVPTSTIDPVHVGAVTRDPDENVHVTIAYTMDRVLGGRRLTVTCVFSADGRLASVAFDGLNLEAESLERVNAELSGP